MNEFLRTQFNYEPDKIRLDSALFCDAEDPEDNRTQQQFKEESDINEIVRRFGLTGEMPDNPRVPQYGDFEEVTDFQSAMNAVRQAEEGFMELPADVRARFANDPQRLMDFLADEANRDEARKLGLVRLPPEVPRDVVTAVDELAARLAANDSK